VNEVRQVARNEKLPEVGFSFLVIGKTSDGFSSSSDRLRKNQSINYNLSQLNNKITIQINQLSLELPSYNRPYCSSESLIISPVLHWLQYALHKSNAAHPASPCVLLTFLAQVGMPLRKHHCKKVNHGYLPALDDSTINTREAELINTRIGDVRDQLQLQLEEG